MVSVRRRAEAPGVQPPERLCRFAAEEWVVPPLKDNATAWEAERWHVLGPYFAWRDARRPWSVGTVMRSATSSIGWSSRSRCGVRTTQRCKR